MLLLPRAQKLRPALRDNLCDTSTAASAPSQAALLLSPSTRVSAHAVSASCCQRQLLLSKSSGSCQDPSDGSAKQSSFLLKPTVPILHGDLPFMPLSATDRHHPVSLQPAHFLTTEAASLAAQLLPAWSAHHKCRACQAFGHLQGTLCLSNTPMSKGDFLYKCPDPSLFTS